MAGQLRFSGISTVSKKVKPRGGYMLNNARVFTKGGKLLDDLSSFTCHYCKLILRNPKQLSECGCRYCESCIEILCEEIDPKCLEDDEPIIKDEIRFDKGCLREIKSFKVECPGAERSCVWIGGFAEYEDHYEECNYIPITCQCGEIIPRGELQNHYLKCAVHTIGSIGSKSSGFDSLNVSCPYENCDFTGNLPEVNNHASEHLHSLATLAFNLQSNLKYLQDDFENMKTTEKKLQDQLQSCKEQFSYYNKEIAKLPQLEQELAEIKRQLVSKIESDSAHSKSYPLGGSNIGRSDELRSLFPRIEQLEQEVKYLKPVVQDAKSDINTQRAQLAGYIDTVQTMQESVTRHSVAMEDIKLRQDILDVKTVHGIFIWKIPEIARRFKDAQDKRTISLYSPPFHTSPHGYRACIRAYLNGDGSGKGTHISVFFVLMKSEHDNLLKWPFDRPVTFELINQESRAQSLSETFMPEKRSASFQQPKSEMNVASGFPRFAPHLVLQQHPFVKGDAMYIRCKIDTGGLSFE